MELRNKVESKDFTLSVVGLGRVGLPLLAAYAQAGVSRLVGVDANASVLGTLREKKVPFQETGLQELWSGLNHSKIELTHDIESGTSGSSVIVVAVGTPLTTALRPDMSQVMSVVKNIFQHHAEECLVIVRSTLVPGTTKNLILPLLERSGHSLIRLVISPERIAEGFALQELRELPEIVGTLDPVAGESAEAFFSLLNPGKLILRTDPGIAETAKILSNVYRYMNFALANDFAMIAETLGLDVHEVIRIANTGYKRGGIPMPGPSGGPCLSKDGYFLPSHTPYAEFVKTAWHINESVPLYAVAKAKEVVGTLYGTSVGVLGMAYKLGSDDTRESPSMRLIQELISEGANVVAHDPHVSGSRPVSELAGCSLIILSCNHPDFDRLGPKDFPAAKLFYDLWGQLGHKKAEFEQRSIRYLAFGRGE